MTMMKPWRKVFPESVPRGLQQWLWNVAESSREPKETGASGSGKNRNPSAAAEKIEKKADELIKMIRDFYTDHANAACDVDVRGLAEESLPGLAINKEVAAIAFDRLNLSAVLVALRVQMHYVQKLNPPKQGRPRKLVAGRLVWIAAGGFERYGLPVGRAGKYGHPPSDFSATCEAMFRIAGIVGPDESAPNLDNLIREVEEDWKARGIYSAMLRD
ncbi:MAG: hypothetical protein LT106_16690 [Burkholderiaceae bacterium]|nr:hypothetical protein [Burkholderiaceae bacterium]